MDTNIDKDIDMDIAVYGYRYHGYGCGHRQIFVIIFHIIS
jgi:hypothetical protein